MASALDAVLQLRSQEEQRQQQAASMALQLQELRQRAEQQAAAQQLQQLQMAQQAKQQEFTNKTSLADLGIKSAELDIKQNEANVNKKLMDTYLNDPDSNSQFQASITGGKVSLKPKDKSSISMIDMDKLPAIENGNVDSFIAALPQDVGTNVKAAANYDLDVNKVYGLRGNSGDRAKFDALVKTVNPNWDAKEYERRNTFLKKWDASPQYSQTQQSLDLVANHLSSLSDSLARLDNGNVLLLNAGKNEIQRQTGQKEIQRALVDAQAVSTEFTKALRGGGVINQAEEESWNKKINASLSPDQAKETISGIVDLIAPRFSSQLNKYKSVMGKLPEGVFTPEAIESIKRLSGKKLPAALQEYINESSSDNTSTNLEKPKISKEAAIAELKRRGKL